MGRPFLLSMKTLGMGEAVPVLLIVLLVGVLAYLYWRHKTTTLTRACRWRFSRASGGWTCSACGAQTDGVSEPKDCLRDQTRRK